MLILSISYVNVAFENASFLEATGGKQKTEGEKNNNFAVEGMEVQRDQDTQVHNYLLRLHLAPDATLGAEV